MVEVEFNVGKASYKIIRGHKKYGTAKFEVYKDNEMLNQDASARDYQEVVEKQILKLNYKSFCQVVILGSATFTPFMQLPTTHRREVIEDLLDIQIFSTMNALLKDKIQDNKESTNKVQYNYDLSEEKIKLQNKHNDSLVKNVEDTINQKKNATIDAEQAIEEYQQKIGQLTREIEKLNEKISDKDNIKSRLVKIETLEEQLEKKIRTVKKDISFYETNDECPTCEQTISLSFKHQALKEKNSKVTDLVAGIDSLEEEFTKTNQRLNDITLVANQVSELNGHVTEHNAAVHQLHKHLHSLMEEMKELESKREEISIDNKEIKSLESELKELTKQKEELSVKKELLNTASILLKDGGIKTKIIKQYIPVINKLINKYLASMDFYVSFDLDENFNETIKSRFRDDFSYDSFSEGEKMRIDLALLFAWRAVAKIKNSISTNLLILDEVFDSSLDGAGTDEFLKILNGLTSDVNVFIISHKGDQLFDKFHSVIKFEKHKNFSRIAA